MKKRMIVLVLVAVMVSGLCVNAMAATRATRISPRLSFSGKTANCSVTVVEVGKLDVTLELWNCCAMLWKTRLLHAPLYLPVPAGGRGTAQDC